MLDEALVVSRENKGVSNNDYVTEGDRKRAVIS